MGEKSVYHFAKPSHLHLFTANQQSDTYQRMCSSAADKLKTLFISLGDYPKIHYMGESPHPVVVAKMLQNKLEEARRDEYCMYPVRLCFLLTIVVSN